MLQVPSANCRKITGYYAAILYIGDILVNKTYNSTDDREISVGGLYPFTDYTLKVITTNDENFTSETLEIFQTSQTSEWESTCLFSTCIYISTQVPHSLMVWKFFVLQFVI